MGSGFAPTLADLAKVGIFWVARTDDAEGASDWRVAAKIFFGDGALVEEGIKVDGAIFVEVGGITGGDDLLGLAVGVIAEGADGLGSGAMTGVDSGGGFGAVMAEPGFAESFIAGKTDTRCSGGNGFGGIGEGSNSTSSRNGLKAGIDQRSVGRPKMSAAWTLHANRNASASRLESSEA